MCFSATASFGAAAVLGTIGSVSVTKAGKPSQIHFSLIPMLFALQQVSEGLLWLSLSHESMYAWKEPTTYIFLFFAQFLWIWWIPLSLYLMEENAWRKKLLFGTFFLGLCCATMLGYRLYLYGVYAGIEHHHIRYVIGSNKLLTLMSSVLYVIAIIVPFFISSISRIKVVGILLTISLLVTWFFYKEYLISVWCFFAALLSCALAYLLHTLRKNERSIEKPTHLPS
jgi:hypothetical protein